MFGMKSDGRRSFILVLSAVLLSGFLLTSLLSYSVSKSSIRDAILDQELPLTSDTIYSEIQKDLIRPILISSMMSTDTFLRDWVLDGEKNIPQITKYLSEVKERYGAVTSFFVSEHSRVYYHPSGILKKVREDEPRDTWYFRVRTMQTPYEINVDPDFGNRDALTIFINYRVHDYDNRFIGATGVGLTVDAVRNMINDYQARYQRDIYFVKPDGAIVLFASRFGHPETSIRTIDGLGSIADSILKRNTGSYQYLMNGKNHLLNVRFIPELNWYLFVEKIEDDALITIRNTLYLNILICLGISAVVIFIVWLTVSRYQSRLEEMANSDRLTGLRNRHAFEILMPQTISEAVRSKTAFAILMIDIDHFKHINDSHGHIAGDQYLQAIAGIIRETVRESDIVFRWGGEEFLAILKGCGAVDALTVAEKLRTAIENHAFAEPVTVSIGVAVWREGYSPDALIARADDALYTAKKNGRNRVCIDERAA